MTPSNSLCLPRGPRLGDGGSVWADGPIDTGRHGMPERRGLGGWEGPSGGFTGRIRRLGVEGTGDDRGVIQGGRGRTDKRRVEDGDGPSGEEQEDVE